jgi:hypothetical protein
LFAWEIPSQNTKKTPSKSNTISGFCKFFQPTYADIAPKRLKNKTAKNKMLT